MSNATITLSGTTYTILDGLYEGQIAPIQYIADPYARLGQTGNGAQLLGSEGPASPVTVHYLTTTMADAYVKQVAFSLMRGQFPTVVEPDGTTFAGAYVESVQAFRRRGRYNHNGTSYSFRCTALFVFKAQA